MSGPMSNPTHVVIAGTRRSWTHEQKQAILAESEEHCDDGFGCGASSWPCAKPVFRWRREALDAERAAALPPQAAFVPLCLPGPVSTRFMRTHAARDNRD